MNALQEKLGARWWWVTGLSLIAFIGVYIFAVRTYLGQYLEDSALLGAKQVDKPEILESLETLHTISVVSLVLVVLAVGTLGLLRHSFRIAFASVSVIVASVLTTEALKKIILPRPDLVNIYPDAAHNSFPSGHTTIGMAIVIALLLAASYSWRGPVMLLTLFWGVSIGAATITASWHRLSDTIGADFVVLIFGSLAALWLLRGGAIKREPPRLYPLRTVVTVILSVVAVGALVVGGILAVKTVQFWDVIPQLEAARQAGVEPHLTAHEDPQFTYNLFLAAQSLALAFSSLAALWFWATFHRLATAPTQ